MDNLLKVSVIGGDTRLIYTAKRFKELGYGVNTFGFELFSGAEDIPGQTTKLSKALENEVIVLGLPCSKNGETLYAPFCEKAIFIKDIAKEGQRIFAGMINGDIERMLSGAGASVKDYFKDEALTLYNAMLTAEALTGILISKLPCSVSGAEIAITGYGRIGFYLARILNSLGAKVTVFSRNKTQLSKAKTLGIEAVELSSFSDKNRNFRAIINTVPSNILGEKELKRLNRNCLLIEAASAPYGIDAQKAEKLGFTVFAAPSLPGKYSPESAGAFIADTVDSILREVKNSG
ncbi:MAG: hypothetical protein J1E34_09475 [Oscillospiraceae bacterium]|nr:hypothetical protein [Oscillospiraceae bacterium]